MKNMFLSVALCLSMKLFATTNVLDTHRDMSFDRSMKAGGFPGPQDPVVGKLDPNGLGVRNFVMMIDETENILMALQNVERVIGVLSQPSAPFSLDFVGLVQSSSALVLLPRNILDNFRIFSWLIQCAKDGVKIVDRKYAKYITQDVFDVCTKIFTFLYDQHQVNGISNFSSDELEQAFLENKAFFGKFADKMTVQAILYASDLYDYIDIFEKNYQNFDFYTLDAVQEYVLCIPNSWQKNNQDSVHDVAGGKEQRQDAFDTKIKNIDVYNGVIQFGTLFKKFEIETHPFDQITLELERIYHVQNEADPEYMNHVYDRVKSYLQFFIPNKVFKKETQDYISFLLPSWNIFVGGHGLSKNCTSGLTDVDFKTLLDWFAQNLQVQTFMYTSCYPAGQKLKDLFAVDTDRLALKKYAFPIIAGGSTFAVTSGGLTENKWTEFFDALTKKQYGKAMLLLSSDNISSMSGVLLNNIYLVKYPFADRFVTINIQEEKSVLHSRETIQEIEDKPDKKSKEQLMRMETRNKKEIEIIHQAYAEKRDAVKEGRPFDVDARIAELNKQLEEEFSESEMTPIVTDSKKIQNKDFIVLSQVTNASKEINIDCRNTGGAFLQSNKITSDLYIKNYRLVEYFDFHFMPQSGLSDLYHFSHISVQGDITFESVHTLFTIPGDVGNYIFLVDLLNIVDDKGAVQDSMQNIMVVNRLGNTEALKNVSRVLQLHVSDIIDLEPRSLSEKTFARNTLVTSWIDSAFYQARVPAYLDACKGFVWLQDGQLQYQFGEVGQDGKQPMNPIIQKRDVRMINRYKEVYNSLKMQVPQSAVTQESAAAFEKMLEEKKAKIETASLRSASSASTVSDGSVVTSDGSGTSGSVSPVEDERSVSPSEVIDPAAGALLGVA